MKPVPLSRIAQWTGGRLLGTESGRDVLIDSIATDTRIVDASDGRAALFVAPPAHEGSDRGYSWLFQQHVTQADEGCDFDFCKPGYR